jgi:hypothetical protein
MTKLKNIQGAFTHGIAGMGTPQKNRCALVENYRQSLLLVSETIY